MCKRSTKIYPYEIECIHTIQILNESYMYCVLYAINVSSTDIFNYMYAYLISILVHIYVCVSGECLCVCVCGYVSSIYYVPSENFVN